jgi:hypothetical protein
MANAIYGTGREGFATAQVNWGTGGGGDPIHTDLIDLADYTVSLTGHTFRSSVPAAARVASFGPLTGKTTTLGVLDTADFTFPTVVGDQAEALIVWKNTGSDATSRLLIFIDTATGLPVTPNGGNIQVIWPAAGIATL